MKTTIEEHWFILNSFIGYVFGKLAARSNIRMEFFWRVHLLSSFLSAELPTYNITNNFLNLQHETRCHMDNNRNPCSNWRVFFNDDNYWDMNETYHEYLKRFNKDNRPLLYWAIGMCIVAFILVCAYGCRC